MAFVLPSRVLETFTTTGTGTITLAGAVSGYRTFSSAMSNADTVLYFMEGGSDYEIGYGTYSGGTLARTTVLKSSNSNNAVDWASGTKTVGIAPIGPSDLDATNLARFTGLLTDVGTWTPSLALATPGTSSWSTATAIGHYIKFGRLVWIFFDLTTTPTIGTGSGNVLLPGLPFASDLNEQQIPISAMGATWTWPRLNPYLRLGASSSQGLLQAMSSASSVANFQSSALTGGSAHVIRGTGSYRTAA